jgi:hypothetical protein
MRPCQLLTTTLALLLGLSACSDSELISREDERADEGFEVIDIDLGESLRGLSVERLLVDVDRASTAELNRSTVSLRLHLLAGQSASIAMRAEDPELDSFLLVKDLRTGETIATNDDQGFMANAGPRDAVVSLRAEEAQDFLIVAAGGADLQSSGRFTIDSIAHADPHVDFSASGPGLEAVSGHLRTQEPSVAEWLALGALAEGDAGMLVAVDGALAGIPLQRRAEFNGVIRSVNDDRETLFDEMIRRSGDSQATRDSVGRAVASVYRVTRGLP